MMMMSRKTTWSRTAEIITAVCLGKGGEVTGQLEWCALEDDGANIR